MAAYLVKGDDSTLVADALRALVAEVTQGDASGLGVEDFGGDDVTPDAVADACQTPPFLADRRVVIFRDVGRFKTEDVQPVIDYLADPLDTSTLILVAGGGGATPPKLLNAVKKVGHVVDASVPGGKGRTGWVADRVRQGPVRLRADASTLLSEHLGEDISRLGSLLESLAAAYGENALIGVDELQPFIGEAGGVAPWDLTDAIDRGDTTTALTHLRRMTSGGGRHPLEIMATLHRHYAAMLRLDGSGVTNENTAAALLGIKPYPAKKALAQCRKLGSRGVAAAVELLATADLDLRGRRAWPDDLTLEVLVARLSRLAKAVAR